MTTDMVNAAVTTASTTYLGQAAFDQLAAAQQVIDVHLVRCPACATTRLCPGRAGAEHVFARYGRLPRRTPGLTRDGSSKLPHSDWLRRPRPRP